MATRARPRPQFAGDLVVMRNDHVWFRPPEGPARWKCALCGFVTFGEPPVYPTPADWMPDDVETLDDGERALCPDPKTGGFR